MFRELYRISHAERPCICVRPAEAHDLAEHLLSHPFWQNTVHPSLPAVVSMEANPPPRDGIEESADRVYLPPGVSQRLLVGLQGVIDGWVVNKDG